MLYSELLEVKGSPSVSSFQFFIDGYFEFLSNPLSFTDRQSKLKIAFFKLNG